MCIVTSIIALVIVIFIVFFVFFIVFILLISLIVSVVFALPITRSSLAGAVLDGGVLIVVVVLRRVARIGNHHRVCTVSTTPAPEAARTCRWMGA